MEHLLMQITCITILHYKKIQTNEIVDYLVHKSSINALISSEEKSIHSL